MKIQSRLLLTFCVAFVATGIVQAQRYDIVISAGHVIDPKNKLDGVMDVAIKGNKVAAVSQRIDKKDGKQVISARGMYVTPGLIDMHVHAFHGIHTDRGLMHVEPDAFSFRSGVTTVVDAGSSGCRSFPDFNSRIVRKSQTRVLAFLNIVGEGMIGESRQQGVEEMDPEKAAAVAREYPSIIVGIKLAHSKGHSWGPTDAAVRAGVLAGIPVMIDFGESEPPLSLEELFFKHLRPGDIFTHCYAYSPKTREAVVDGNGKVKPFVIAAQRRGVRFDVGHGGGSFCWNQAMPSIQQGFIADVISTDLHRGSMNGGMKDMANVMSKFLNMGLSIQDVVLRSSWNPAQVIRRPELGNLSVGTEADVTVFSLNKGNFGFLDSNDEKRTGTAKLVTELTIRAGNIVWDLNGISSPERH